METKPVKVFVKEFRDALTQGMEGFTRAGQVYVEALDENPKNSEVFLTEFDGVVSPTMFGMLEKVGRKCLHPQLILGGGPNANKIRRLPYSVQERVFAGERFEMLVSGGEHILVDVREATKEQAEQLVGDDHIRTLSEQRAWMEAQKSQAEAEPEVMPYVIAGGTVTFRKGVKLTKQEVRRILAEI
jgi:hypothetical protein